MAAPNFSNGWTTTLSASLTNVATTVTVTSTAGMPSRPFLARIKAEGANTDEIIEVTGLSGSTITFTRAAEPIANGTQSASAHASGATITHVLTKGSLINALVHASFIDVRNYGAALDVRGVYDAAVAGGALSTVTSATAAFTSADTGKKYYLASTSGAVTTGTLTYVSGTSCTMSQAAGGAMTGARLIFGTDDTTAWQNALNAAVPGQTVDCSGGSWRSLCTGHLNVPAGVKLGLYNRGPFDPQTNPAMNSWGPTFVIAQDNTTAFITLNTQSGLGDFIFYSANQVPPTASTPTAFKPFISTASSGVAGVHIGSPYLANSYMGLLLEGGRHIVDNPQVGSLETAIIIDHSLDCIVIRRISCSPYWRICEGMTYTPTAGTLDEFAANYGWAIQVARADSFWIGEIFVYGGIGAIALIDSPDTGISPRNGYGRIGMIDADTVAYGVYAQATQSPGVLIAQVTIGANGTGVGLAGQAGVCTVTGGTTAPKVIVKSWSVRGSFAAGNSSNGAGTLVVPGTNPG